jgi:hypothetical protein
MKWNTAGALYVTQGGDTIEPLKAEAGDPLRTPLRIHRLARVQSGG